MQKAKDWRSALSTRPRRPAPQLRPATGPGAEDSASVGIAAKASPRVAAPKAATEAVP